MPRASVGLLFPLLLALTLPATKAPSAPIPKVPAKKDSLYFPTKVGAKWVYTAGDKDQTEVVTAVEHKPKEQVWVVSVKKESLRKPNEEAIEKWEVSEQGLRLLKDDFGPVSDVRWWLKIPAKAGEKWDLIESGDFWCVTLEPKKVKVPAGEFEAVGVEVYLGKKLFVTRWYAPGIGLVKIGDDKKTTVALKSFTPGNDE